MRVVGTIEARMGSTRLPGKTMMEIYDGMSLLECVVRRFRMAARVDEVVVATTIEAGDDPIADWCAANQVSLFRGSEKNVLERVAGAAVQFGADAIVQMGADSAYLDYQLIDQLAGHYAAGRYDYVCNDLRLTYPLGIYGHIVKVERLLELVDHNDLSDNDRSDVVRYIWEHPEQYRILNIEAEPDFFYPQMRLTIDYPEDMALAKALYRHFGGYRFTTSQIIGLYGKSPELFAGVDGLVQHSAPFLAAHR